MPRVTRAKAHAIAEGLHIDEDEVLALQSDPATDKPATPEPSGSQRAALGELAPNSAGSKEGGDVGEALKGEGKMRKGGRKGKGKKDDLGASTATQPEESDTINGGGDAVTEQEDTQSNAQAVDDLTSATESMSLGAQRPGSPVASATPKVIQQLRKDTPGKRSTSNKENVEPGNLTQSPALAPMEPVVEHSELLDATPTQAATPVPDVTQAEAPQTTSQVVEEAQPTDSSVIIQQQTGIEAMDELEEAVEKVTMEIPEVQASPEKKRKISMQRKPIAALKAAPVVKTTKASQARLSIAQGNKADASKAPSLGRPPPSTTLGRTGSVRQSTAPAVSLGRSSSVRQSTAQPVTAAEKRVTSTSSSTSNFRFSRLASEAPRERKEVVIPHSKPRLISLSFPTPPPPQKSTKPATKSTFQLPGEAVAARLKAAREERLKLDAESGEKTARSVSGADAERKPGFKARPVPDMLKKTPSVRHTAASRARESIAGGAMPPPSGAAGGLKRSSTVTGARQRPMSMQQAPAGLQISKRPTPRPSTAAATTQDSKRVTSTASLVGGKSANKGKEVFDRVANAKASAEKEKREKEENAKRARAEAAERSRAMSREWAEKRKGKKVGAPFGAATAPAAIEAPLEQVRVTVAVAETPGVAA